MKPAMNSPNVPLSQVMEDTCINTQTVAHRGRPLLSLFSRISVVFYRIIPQINVYITHNGDLNLKLQYKFM